MWIKGLLNLKTLTIYYEKYSVVQRVQCLICDAFVLIESWWWLNKSKSTSPVASKFMLKMQERKTDKTLTPAFPKDPQAWAPEPGWTWGCGNRSQTSSWGGPARPWWRAQPGTGQRRPPRSTVHCPHLQIYIESMWGRQKKATLGQNVNHLPKSDLLELYTNLTAYNKGCRSCLEGQHWCKTHSSSPKYHFAS